MYPLRAVSMQSVNEFQRDQPRTRLVTCVELSIVWLPLSMAPTSVQQPPDEVARVLDLVSHRLTFILSSCIPEIAQQIIRPAVDSLPQRRPRGPEILLSTSLHAA